MTADARYRDGRYWEQNPGMHEEDSDYKVGVAGELIASKLEMPGTVIDIGCGSGLTSYLLARKFGALVHGVDISPVSIEHARKTYRHDGLRYTNADVNSEEIRSQIYDLGVMFDVFEHVEDYLGFLRACRPLARNWCFNIPLDMNAVSVALGSYLKHRRNFGHIHYFSPASALATLEDAGYEIIATKTTAAFLHHLRANPSLTGAVASLPRLFAYSLSPDICSRILGGTYFMVLARGST